MQGYKEIKLEIARPNNFVLGNEAGHEIDVHVIVLNNKEHFSYGPIENGEIYPIATLSGLGVLNGKLMKCISPGWMVKFHNTGYKLREIDFKDVPPLCNKFGIDIPKEFIR